MQQTLFSVSKPILKKVEEPEIEEELEEDFEEDEEEEIKFKPSSNKQIGLQDFGVVQGTVLCKESYNGFSVCYPDSAEYFKLPNARIIRYGEEMIKKHNSFEEAKKYFEEKVLEDYKRPVKWSKHKFQDCKGYFYLNNVKVNYELKVEYITDYHLEFNSCKIPNLITETGYRSDFFHEGNILEGDDFRAFLKKEIEMLINCSEGKKNKKPIRYSLKFDDEIEKEKVNVPTNPINRINPIVDNEKLIESKMKELKELLKNKYKEDVKIQVVKC